MGLVQIEQSFWLCLNGLFPLSQTSLPSALICGTSMHHRLWNRDSTCLISAQLQALCPHSLHLSSFCGPHCRGGEQCCCHHPSVLATRAAVPGPMKEGMWACGGWRSSHQLYLHACSWLAQTCLEVEKRQIVFGSFWKIRFYQNCLTVEWHPSPWGLSSLFSPGVGRRG